MMCSDNIIGAFFLFLFILLFVYVTLTSLGE